MSIELRAVSRAYDGRTVLKEVSLTIEAGQSVAILGRSGSGKSTLLRLLAGLEAPTNGQVLVSGTVASESGRILLPPHRRGISMVFQDLALWPNLSVIGNVELGLSGLHLSRAEAKARALASLALCAIDRLSEHRISELSGGEQQRVALARALSTRPEYLFLDEPFSGLDAVTKAQVAEGILGLARRERIAVVLVAHDPWDALALSRKAVVLEEGSILEAGSWGALLRAPQSRLLAVYKERLETVFRLGQTDRQAP